MRIHKQKISNNKLLDKEEAEADKSEHQTSVLSIISSATLNDGITKVSILKNKKNIHEIMYEAKLHINRLFLEEKENFWRLPTGTFHLLRSNVMTKYDLCYTSFSIPVDTIIGRVKYGTTSLKPGTLYVTYQI